MDDGTSGGKGMRLGLFLPRATPYYVTLYLAMKRGFEALGVTVEGGAGLLSDPSLAVFCHEFRPHAVMEMNRTRAQLPSLPSAIPHLAWIVDPVNQHGPEGYKGSEILYGFGGWFGEEPRHYDALLVRRLLPASCPGSYFPEERPWEWDFSFAGHMSRPWSREELERRLGFHQGAAVSFGTVLERYHQRILELERLARGDSRLAPEHHQVLAKVLEEFALTPQGLEQSVYYDLLFRHLRLEHRQRFLDQVVELSDSVRFMGTGGWEEWPRYAPFFVGFAAHAETLRQLYQASRINLHQGNPLHFRVMDCLASGGFLLVMPSGDCQEQQQSPLVPGEHYVEVNGENFTEMARYHLAHPEERRRIARQGAEEVAKRHTWSHRAGEILADLASLGVCSGVVASSGDHSIPATGG